MYKIGARHPVLRRGEARGSRTAGQVGASGCGLTWGPSANVGPGSSSATAPILGLPCAMERGTQLCSHTAPDAKKYTGDQNVPVPTSELRWEQKAMAWQPLAPPRDWQAAFMARKEPAVFHTGGGFSRPTQWWVFR